MPMTFFASSVLTGLPGGETIRRKAAEIIGRPEFQLENDRDDGSLTLLVRLIRWILAPFRWLIQLLDGLPSPLWWFVVILMLVTAIGLCVHIVWSFIHAVKGAPRPRLGSLPSDAKAAPEDFERSADAAEQDGDYIGAIRLRFRAGILRIELSEKKPLRRGLTNHELLRRYRASPLFEPLQWFVQTIDSKWYGHGECVPEDCVTCRAEYSRICLLANRRPNAVSA